MLSYMKSLQRTLSTLGHRQNALAPIVDRLVDPFDENFFPNHGFLRMRRLEVFQLAVELSLKDVRSTRCSDETEERR